MRHYLSKAPLLCGERPSAPPNPPGLNVGRAQVGDPRRTVRSSRRLDVLIAVIFASTSAPAAESDVVRQNQPGRQQLMSLSRRIELESFATSLRMSTASVGRPHARLPGGMVLPSRFDWREWEGLTPVKSQGSCGSCWAFAATAALESGIRVNDAVSEDLSEQWLVSCAEEEEDGCGGEFGSPELQNLVCGSADVDPCGDSGAVLEADFRYVGSDVACSCPFQHPYCIDDWSEWLLPTLLGLEGLKTDLLVYGPVVVTIYADEALKAYQGPDVFHGCPGGTNLPNHDVLLVGWDDTLGGGVWIVKNSWGFDWGNAGFGLLPYGCGSIAEFAEWAIHYRDSNLSVWVDLQAGLCDDHDGSFSQPFCSLAAGAAAVAANGVIRIKAGQRIERNLTITKPMTIRAVHGDVVIGR